MGSHYVNIEMRWNADIKKASAQYFRHFTTFFLMRMLFLIIGYEMYEWSIYFELKKQLLILI